MDCATTSMLDKMTLADFLDTNRAGCFETFYKEKEDSQIQKTNQIHCKTYKNNTQ